MAQSIYVGGELFGLPFRVDWRGRFGSGGSRWGKGKKMADGISLLVKCRKVNMMR